MLKFPQKDFIGRVVFFDTNKIFSLEFELLQINSLNELEFEK